MAPKAKKPEEKKATNIGPTETEKEFFLLEIAALNKKIARLRGGIDDYEVENLRLQEAYEKLDQDRNDVISFLKKTLAVKNEEIAELKEKVKGLEETRERETKEYKGMIAELEKNFTIMKSTLSSENKLLSGKLNTLEEFRAIRDDLMMKFERQEQNFKDQELMYKRIIYDAEKKLIISKDMLKKDMEKRLLQLAQDYQDATEMRVAASTHRVLRENIAINHELDFILSDQEKLHAQNAKFKEREKASKIGKELAEEERDEAIRKSVIQLKVIEQLTSSVVAMKKQYARDQKEKKEIEDLESKIQILDTKNKSLSNKVKILEQRLHSKENAEFYSRVESEKVVLENRKLKKIIRDAVFSLQAVFKADQLISVEQTQEMKNRALLLNKLAAVLAQYRTPMHTESGESIISFGAIYKKGDLGFVPVREPSKIKRYPSKLSKASSAVSSVVTKVSEEILEEEGSFVTVPSTTLVPAFEAEEIEEIESIPSFAKSEESSEEEPQLPEEEEDIESKLTKSKLAIQASVLKDLKSSEFTSKIGGITSIQEGVEQEEKEEKEPKEGDEGEGVAEAKSDASVTDEHKEEVAGETAEPAEPAEVDEVVEEQKKDEA